MDIWRWLVAHSEELMAVLGPVVFPAALLTIVLPMLIAANDHARARAVPAFPLTPGQHFRFMGYAFSRDAWRAGGLYQRTLLLLFRLALLVGACCVTLLFAVLVSVQAG